MTQTEPAMSEPSLSELVAEIRAGLLGVTPGPWRAISAEWQPWDGAIEVRGVGIQPDSTICWTPSGGNEVANAAHIALMSPDNITRLLDALEAERASATRLRDALLECADMLEHIDQHGDQGLPLAHLIKAAREACAYRMTLKPVNNGATEAEHPEKVCPNDPKNQNTGGRKS